MCKTHLNDTLHVLHLLKFLRDRFALNFNKNDKLVAGARYNIYKSLDKSLKLKV